MNRRNFGKVLLASALAPAIVKPRSLFAQRQAWSIRAAIAECCSCPIPCPCNFGRPTDRGCFGNRLIEIREGEIDGVDLSNAAFLVTFSMGQWTRFYVRNDLPQEKAAALDRLFPLAFGSLHRIAQVVERVPLAIERGDGVLRFSAPESSVEMKLLPGLDGGPIRISGLPNPAFQSYVQYDSVSHVHNSASANWSYSGTNGFTSEMIASG